MEQVQAGSRISRATGDLAKCPPLFLTTFMRDSEPAESRSTRAVADPVEEMHKAALLRAAGGEMQETVSAEELLAKSQLSAILGESTSPWLSDRVGLPVAESKKNGGDDADDDKYRLQKREQLIRSDPRKPSAGRLEEHLQRVRRLFEAQGAGAGTLEEVMSRIATLLYSEREGMLQECSPG